MSEHSPVTAEGLRERLARAVRAAGREVDVNALNAIIAELAGDPGDLPARMAEAMREHRLDERSDDEPGLTICVCGEQVVDFKTHWARVALSVRWEHAASQAAEVERLQSALDGAGQHIGDALRRLEESEAEVERLRAELAEWNTAKRHHAFSHCAQNIGHVTMAAFGEKIAEKVQERAERDAVMAGLEQTTAERDALKAAIERVRALHAKRDVFEVGPDGFLGQRLSSGCEGCSDPDLVADLEAGELTEDLAPWPCPTTAALDAPEIPERRCESCDHLAEHHQPEGCWYSVTIGAEGRNLVCPCAVPRVDLAAPETPGDAETEDRDG